MQKKERIILQLELKDIFFHCVQDQPQHGNYIVSGNQFYLIRNHFREFILTLSPHFDFSVWTVYPAEESETLIKYINDQVISLKYCRSKRDTSQYLVGQIWALGKRLKRLRYMDIVIEQIICIETHTPLAENYHNTFLLSPFTGQHDEELLDAALRLLDLSGLQDTTRLNP